MLHIRCIRADTLARGNESGEESRHPNEAGGPVQSSPARHPFSHKAGGDAGKAGNRTDFDVVARTVGDAYTPYQNQMLEAAAMVYAANFTVDEMRQIDTFLHQPVGQKVIEKWIGDSKQTAQIGQDISQKAAEDLKRRLTEALRQKGHKL